MQNLDCGGRETPSQSSLYGFVNDAIVRRCANVLPPSTERSATSVLSSPSAATRATALPVATSESANGWGTGMRFGADHVAPSSELAARYATCVLEKRWMRRAHASQTRRPLVASVKLKSRA